MSKPRTTIILILMASDKNTVEVFDCLLRELQRGLNRWNMPSLPKVFCFYARLEGKRKMSTFYFPLTKRSLKAGATRPIISPPKARTVVTGDIGPQVTQFLGYVASRLPSQGPIRMLIGAHGFAALGFSPREFIDRLKLLGKDFLKAIDSKLLDLIALDGGHHIPAGDRAPLHKAIEQIGPPPGGFTSRAGKSKPDLTLDGAASAVRQLPKSRLQTLIIHSCQMSGVEAITALGDIPHHIASESDVTGHMRLSTWFHVLGAPDASARDITRACFQSLTANGRPFAEGCFSSHHTAQVGELIKHLNTLGDHLFQTLTDASGTTLSDVRKKIRNAREGGRLTLQTVDIVALCRSFIEADLAPKPLLQSIIKEVGVLQMSPRVRTNGDTLFKPFGGINLFFPQSDFTAYSTTDLPPSFQARAAGWCRFLDKWHV